ncbi:MAG: MFS transporter [Thermomicrobiales bacterium]
MATLFGSLLALMPIFAEDVLGVRTEGWGCCLCTRGRSGDRGFRTERHAAPDRAGPAIMASIMIYGACLVGFGLSRSFVLSLLFLAGSGAADVMSATLRHATRNLVTPDDLRGRVAAVHRTLAVGGPQLGDFRAGVAASVIGAGPSVAIGGMATVLSAAAIAIVPAIGRYRILLSCRRSCAVGGIKGTSTPAQ